MSLTFGFASGTDGPDLVVDKVGNGLSGCEQGKECCRWGHGGLRGDCACRGLPARARGEDATGVNWWCATEAGVWVSA
jgi:hypothetical protein